MTEKVFKTKTGQCHILPDRIVLTREGFVGNASEVVVGNNISRALIIYVLFLFFMLYKTYTLYVEGSNVRMMLHMIVATLLLVVVLKSINNSATPVIFKDKIRNVIFKQASKLTRAYFIITFENDKGKLKRRLIMLPGSLTGGETATEEAITMMKEEGLLR